MNSTPTSLRMERPSVDYAANPRSRDRHHAGIARCLRAMRVGERALFHLPPELAYGDEGNFTFPAVPPRCHVICDLELIAARGSAAEPETLRADMLFEERLARASEHRKRGNVAFGEGGDGDGDEKEAKTREARAEYEMALSFLTDDMMMQLPPGPHADAAAAEKLPAHLNLCACFLRLGRHDDAIDQANRALIVDPKCAKAYFRRGEARRALGRDDDARADYAKANELRQSAGGGEDPAIRRALRELDCEDAKRARARKEVFGGLFGAPGAGAAGGEGGEGEKTRGGEASPRGERSDGGGGVFGRIARAFGFRGSRGAKR